MKKNNGGFSLIELIVVIAIMAVLIGVLTPTLIKYVAKARTQVCESNREEITKEIDLMLIDDSRLDAEKAFEQLKSENNGYATVCKAHGDITFKWVDKAKGTYMILCSEHSESMMDMSADNAKKIAEIMQDVKNGKNGTMDSGALNVSNTCESANAVKKLQEAGINLSNLNIGTWQYYENNGQNLLYWSTVDISTLKPGDKVPVIKYNLDSGNYTVYTSTVSTGQTATGGDQTYNILGNYSGYTESTANKDKQTYEEAVKLYDQLQNQMTQK